jgi:hypothetical protein
VALRLLFMPRIVRRLRSWPLITLAQVGEGCRYPALDCSENRGNVRPSPNWRSTGEKARRIGKLAVAAWVRGLSLIYLNVFSTALNEIQETRPDGEA